MTEVELKEIVGIWSGGVRKLVIAVGFSTVDPEGLLDDGMRLAPSRRSVSIGGLLGGFPHTVGWWNTGWRYRIKTRIRRGGR